MQIMPRKRIIGVRYQRLLFSVRGMLVNWFSRKQRSVTLSTKEAEYVAMAGGVKETLYGRGILRFLRMNMKFSGISVFEKNKSAKALAKTPPSSLNSKHIDVLHHFLREIVANEDIKVERVSTKERCADILTKALGKESFKLHRDLLLGLRE